MANFQSKPNPRRWLWLILLLVVSALLLVALSQYESLEAALLCIPPLLVIETGCYIGFTGRREKRSLRWATRLSAAVGTAVSAVAVTVLGVAIASMLASADYFKADDVPWLLLWISVATAGGGFIATACAVAWYAQRSWFRLRLRTLLILMLLVSIPLAWFAFRHQRSRHLRRSITGLQSDYGISCKYDKSVPRWSWFGRNFSLSVDDVVVVDFRGTPRPDDDALRRLAEFKKLRGLVLGFASNQVTDTGLSHLNDLKHLERLLLDGSNISDEGLAQLQSHRNLTQLYLRNTSITDQGIKYLRQLVGLKTLDVTDTKITERGAEELRRALPNTEVSSNQRVTENAQRAHPMQFFDDADIVSLALATKYGDIDEINRLAAGGTNVNADGKYGVNLLVLAILWRQKQSYRRLLELGGDPNAQVHKRIKELRLGHSPMSCAASIEDDSEWLELALAYGGNPNLVNPSDQSTPLFAAFSSRHFKNMELLIDAGADLDHADDNGNTRVMRAARNNKFYIVHQLLQAGADFRRKNHEGHDLARVVGESRVYRGQGYVETIKWRDKVLAFLTDRGVSVR